MGSRGTFLVLNEKSCSEVIKSVIGIFHQALNSSKKNCPLATHFYAIKANLMLIGWKVLKCQRNSHSLKEIPCNAFGGAVWGRGTKFLYSCSRGNEPFLRLSLFGTSKQTPQCKRNRMILKKKHSMGNVPPLPISPRGRALVLKKKCPSATHFSANLLGILHGVMPFNANHQG